MVGQEMTRFLALSCWPGKEGMTLRQCARATYTRRTGLAVLLPPSRRVETSLVSLRTGSRHVWCALRQLIRCQSPGSTRKKLALAANASALSVYVTVRSRVLVRLGFRWVQFSVVWHEI